MYLPHAFRETDVDALHQLVTAYPLATLVTSSDDGLDANHIPMLLDRDPAPFGTLRGHVARGNAVWQHAAGSEALAIFHGPNVYVSPSWYPTSQQTGKAVPTWNYIVVHAHGRLRIVEDAAWLRAHVEALTRAHESQRSAGWSVSDAPADFIDRMLAGIVGIEMVMTRLEGKAKLSQNRTPEDREAVIEALMRQPDCQSQAVAAVMRERPPNTPRH